jgi:hypothetical protein
MTASTPYTNRSVPMAQATHRDFGLSDYLNEYPPEVNGFVELRLLYSSADTGFSTSYAASFIQVHGTTWTLVKGGKVNCSAGKAISPEAKLPSFDKAGKQPPQLLSVVAAKAIGAPTSRADNLAARDAALHPSSVQPSMPGTGSPGSDQSAGSSSGGGSSTAADADAGSSGASGGASAGLIGGLAIAVLLVAGGWLWWRRAGRSSGQH